MKLIKSFYLIIFTIILSGNCIAQYGSIGSTDARSIGMGKTYTANATGVFSVGFNPANIMMTDGASYQLATVFPLPTASVNGGINVLSLDDINYFFGGVDGESRLLSDADKQRLNQQFEDGGFVSANAGVQLLSFQVIPGKNIGAFGFAISDFIGGKSKIPAAIIDLTLNGNPVDKVFNMSEGEFSAWWIRNYSISYARNIKELSAGVIENVFAGISVKLVHGYAYAGSEEIGTYLSTSDKHEISGQSKYLAYSSFSDNFGVRYEFDSLNHESSFQLFPGPAGTGYGIDFGISVQLVNHLTLSAAVTDIGSIIWRKNTARFINDESLFLDDLTESEKFDSLIDAVTGTAEPVGEFSTGLASAFRFGASYRVSEFDESNFPGYLLLAIEYSQGFNELPGNTINPRFGFGLEWKILSFLPTLRTGIGYSEVEGINWTIGLGLVTSLLEVNVATQSFQTTFLPGSSSNVSLSLSSKWKFN